MWTYFFELRGAEARTILERIARDLPDRGSSAELLRSADEPDLYLLRCSVPKPIDDLPEEPRVWRFLDADSAIGG